jgi:hypothetical protein
MWGLSHLSATSLSAFGFISDRAVGRNLSLGNVEYFILVKKIRIPIACYVPQVKNRGFILYTKQFSFQALFLIKSKVH